MLQEVAPELQPIEMDILIMIGFEKNKEITKLVLQVSLLFVLMRVHI